MPAGLLTQVRERQFICADVHTLPVTTDAPDTSTIDYPIRRQYKEMRLSLPLLSWVYYSRQHPFGILSNNTVAVC